MTRMQKNLVEWDTKLFDKNVFEIQNTDYFDKNELKEVDESCSNDYAFISFIKLNNRDYKKNSSTVMMISFDEVPTSIFFVFSSFFTTASNLPAISFIVETVSLSSSSSLRGDGADL